MAKETNKEPEKETKQETKKSKILETGMYNCVNLKTKEKVIYHSSTAQTLRDKGLITVGNKIKKYIPKGAFGKEVSE